MDRFSSRAKMMQHKVLDLVLELQKSGDFVTIDFSNYGWDVFVNSQAGVFASGKPYQISQGFCFDRPEEFGYLIKKMEARLKELNVNA